MPTQDKGQVNFQTEALYISNGDLALLKKSMYFFTILNTQVEKTDTAPETVDTVKGTITITETM